MSDVLYVPDFESSLLSISALNAKFVIMTSVSAEGSLHKAHFVYELLASNGLGLSVPSPPRSFCSHSEICV